MATKQQTYGQFTHVMRIVYMVVVWMFIAGLFLQFFIVGLSIFISPTWWGTHSAFGRGFAVITLVLLLLALAGRYPPWTSGDDGTFNTSLCLADLAH